MRFFCPGCGSRYNKEDDEIPAEGLVIPCQKCGFQISVKGKPSFSKPPVSKTLPNVATPEEEDEEESQTVMVDNPMAKTLQGMEARKSGNQPAARPKTEDQLSAAPKKDTGKQKAAGAPIRGETHKDRLVAKPLSESPSAPESKPALKSSPPVEKPGGAGTSGGPPEAAKPEQEPAAEKAAPAKPAKEPRAPRLGPAVDRFLERIGTGRSGPAFRFRDLFYALSVPCDPRKLGVAAFGLFLASLAFAGILKLGSLVDSGVVHTVALIVGCLVFSVLLLLFLGVTTRQTELEMLAGKHLPIREGVAFVREHPKTVLGTPLLLVVAIVALLLGSLILSFIGKIPYAGPLAWGVTFIPNFALAFLAVGMGVLLVLACFSYLPVVAGEKLSLVGAPRRTLAFFWARPGRYLLHWLIALAVSFVVFFVLNWMATTSFSALLRIAGLTEQDLGSIFVRVPLVLFGPLLLSVPTPVLMLFGAAPAEGWQFAVSGWLVGIGCLAVFSLLNGFVLVYFFGAGVVNAHLLRERQGGDAG